MFEKEVVIDGRGHMMGRLASIVAKQLVNGQRCVVVRCEAINISGSLFRNHLKVQEVRHRRNNTNPRRNFKHWKSPSRMFWKVIRGMLPHKTPKGAAALGRLKVFEGMPYPYDHKKRVVVPEALKVLRLKSHRKHCVLGDLASKAGWTKADIVNKVEEQRKAKAEKWFKDKQKKTAAKAATLKDGRLKSFTDELKKLGF